MLKSTPLASVIPMLLAGLTFSACGKSAPRPAAPGPGEAPPLEGSLAKNVAEIQAHRYVESCDRRDEKIRKELAAALDAKQDAIQKYLRAVPFSGEFREIKVGPARLRERLQRRERREGWQEEPASWTRTYDYYLQIKDQPVGEEWGYVNAEVRSLLMDDRNRTQGVTYRFDKDSAPRLAAALAELDACLARPDCPGLPRADTTATWLRTMPYYAESLDEIDAAAASLRHRELLKQLRRDLDGDAETYRLRHNPDLRATGPGAWTLTLDAGAFRGAEKQVAQFIERIWKPGGDRGVTVAWADAPGPFRFVFEEAAGERAFTRWKDRTVHLFPGDTSDTVAHEVGHVIGFYDHYYTVWRPETCGYVFQVDDADVMSNSPSGAVTPGEWADLAKEYPFGAPTAAPPLTSAGSNR